MPRKSFKNPLKKQFGGVVAPAGYQPLVETMASDIYSPAQTTQALPAYTSPSTFTSPAPSLSVPSTTYGASTSQGMGGQFKQIFANKAVRMVILNLVVMLVFGIVYTIWMWQRPDDWASPEGTESVGLNGFYASVITHTTVGFGDFYPTSVPAKIITMIHGMLVFYTNLYVGLS